MMVRAGDYRPAAGRGQRSALSCAETSTATDVRLRAVIGGEGECEWDSPLDITAIIDSIDLKPIIKAHQAGGRGEPAQ